MTRWQKFGCAVYSTGAIALIPLLFLLSIFGQCGAWADADCQPMSSLEQLMWFPGSAIVIVAGGIVMMRFFKREMN